MNPIVFIDEALLPESRDHTSPVAESSSCVRSESIEDVRPKTRGSFSWFG